MCRRRFESRDSCLSMKMGGWGLSERPRERSGCFGGKIIFLAHLSRRFIGELIGQVGLRLASVVCRPYSLNIFSSETAWPIKIKFHMELPWDEGTKVYSNGPGHITKMAATPIYGKNLKKSSPEPKGR